ncbi:acyl-CoA dehydrogenase, partial [Kosakonia quasisacchari]
MKRIVTALALTALALPAIASQYAKSGAILTLKPGNGNAEF